MARISKVEIATLEQDPKFAFGASKLLMPQDDILFRQGRGEFLKIYRDLERDERVSTVLEKRYTNVSRAPWVVEPGKRRGMEATAEDKRMADLVNDVISSLGMQTEEDARRHNAFAQFRTGFDSITAGLLDAILMGFAVGECIWAQDGNIAYVDQIKLRDQRRFRFDPEMNLRLITRENMFDGVELPARKFLVYTWGSKWDPYGRGLGHQLYWPVFFKRQGMSYWLRFLDKFGMPTVVAKTPPGTSETDKAKLLDMAESVQNEAAVRIEEAQILELLEANRSALSSGGYDALVEHLDNSITISVLGSTLSTDIGDKGSFAAADVHKDETRLRGMVDSEALNEYLSRSLSAWITHFNSDSAVPPIIKRLFPEEQNLSEVATRWSQLNNIGYIPTPDFVNETFGKGADEPVFEKKAETGNGVGNSAGLDARNEVDEEEETADVE